MSIRIEGVPTVRRRAVALGGQGWRVRGTVRNYVPGQRVEVRFRRGRRAVGTITAPITPIPRSPLGRFVVVFRGTKPGGVKVTALHAATPQQVAMSATNRVDVITPSAGGGSSGMRVRYLQARLSALGYMVSRGGRFDDATARAVLTYRKVNKMRRNSSASTRIFFRLAQGKGVLRARFPHHGRHAEIFLARQVLGLFYGGRIYKTFHISSGAPSTPTPLGSFSVFLKTPGFNSLGMLHSNYFAGGGYATHGYHSVPTYPASHGCVRQPNANARFIYNWMRYGTRVDVTR
jgi:L,D-transpeptidase-like protein